MTWLPVILIALLIFGGLAYWLLVTTEGVYLGPRVVVWLYDLVAHRYDAIKQFEPEEELLLVGRPLLAGLAGVGQPHVLDVATGAGRVPEVVGNLIGQANGRLIGLDASAKMLAQAAAKNSYGHVEFVRGTAVALPFLTAKFDAAICLEALEFFPSDEAALHEMARVLRPGGFLMVTRRIGWEGKAFLIRYRSEEMLKEMLVRAGFCEVKSQLWLLDYELVIARRA